MIGCQLDWNLAADPTQPPTCVRYVSATADAEASDGLTWQTAFRNPQDAIDAAAAATTSRTTCEVWVKRGTYLIHQGLRSNTLQLAPRVAVYGGFSGEETTRSQRDWQQRSTVLDGRGADGDDRVFHVVTGADHATLDGFTVTHGLADGDDDAERRGGGMLNEETSPTVRNILFTDNEAAEAGGAVANIGSTPTFVDCRFLDNTAGSGGAVSSRNAVVELTSCVFDGNSATQRGGALACSASATVRITHAVFVHNHADQSGGAIFNVDDAFVTVTNSILWKNSAEDDTDDIASSAELHLSYSVVKQELEGDGVLHDAPRFVDRTGGDFRLEPNSPCIDAADGARASAEDLGGRPRVDDPDTANTGIGQPSFADIGAYEYQPGAQGDDDDD